MKSKPIVPVFFGFVAISVAILAIGYLLSPTKSTSGRSAPIRVGWQPAWANTGHLVAILKQTDILEKQGIQVEFVPFSYGGPMAEAALGDSIDVMLAGEQPVHALLSKSERWTVVARLPRYRSALLVPKNSPLKELRDLDGKTIFTAIGSTTHRDAAAMMASQSPPVSAKFAQLDQTEHATFMATAGIQDWGDAAALATYDPAAASGIGGDNPPARILAAWASPALLAVRRPIADTRATDVASFLQAIRLACVRFAENPSQANNWYRTESGLSLSDDEYAQLASFEPNLSRHVLKEVDFSLTTEDVEASLARAKIALQLGILREMPPAEALKVRVKNP